MPLLSGLHHFLVYIDDCIVFGPNAQALDQVVKDLRTCPQQFTVEDQGDVGDFLGIRIKKKKDGSIHLSRPQLIDSIIQDLHLQPGSNSKSTPSVTSTLLYKDTDGPDMQPEFHYRSVIGKLNFLENSTRPDISVSIHQCAGFSEAPKKSYTEAVKWIGRFLLATRDKGIFIHPNKSRQFDYWMDADFTGNWHQADAHSDPMTPESRSDWIVRFAGAPITWGILDANHHGNVNHRGGLHRPLNQPKGGYSADRDPHGSTSAWRAHRRFAAQGTLHCF